MTFCKIDGCLNHGSYGGYCTSHQSQRAERAEAERDELTAQLIKVKSERNELERAIIQYQELQQETLRERDAARAEVERLQERLHKCDGMAHEINLLTDEVKRLRSAQSIFLAALDYWLDELHQHGVEIVNVPSRATMLEARAALDAPAEKEQTK